jgi:tetratricopeptide (TPR) repeat protein
LRHRVGGGGAYFHEAESEMSGKLALLWLMLVPGFAGLWQLQRGIDVKRAAMQEEQDELVLRSGPLVKALSLEYAPLMADLYWTRVVQYYGNKQVDEQRNFDLLWPLLDLTTTLDPHLLVAYRFGSMFLSEPPRRGAGLPDKGIELLHRGIDNNPEYWRFYEDLGLIYYFDVGDTSKAAEAFLEGSRKPGAMVWMKTFAARISEKGQNRETAAMLWNEIYNSATTPEVKKNAQTHLQLLRAQADCEALDNLAGEYEKQTGHRPRRLRDLVDARLLPGVPVDPVGRPYVLDADGLAQINPASPLFAEQSKPTFKPLN